MMLMPEPQVFKIMDAHYICFELKELDVQKCLAVLLKSWSEQFSKTNLRRASLRIVHKSRNAKEEAAPLFQVVRAISDGFKRFTGVSVYGRIAKVEYASKNTGYVIELELRELAGE